MLFGGVVVQDLVAEYKQSLRLTRRLWERATEPADRQILSSMIRDLQWTIRYMETGWPPPPEEMSREYRRRRVVLVDPHVMQAVVAAHNAMLARARANMVELTRPQRSALEAVLQGLTERERDVYLLVAGHSLSQREVARLMGLSRRQVRKLHESAARKVDVNARRLLGRRADHCGAY